MSEARPRDSTATRRARRRSDEWTKRRIGGIRSQESGVRSQGGRGRGGRRKAGRFGEGPGLSGARAGGAQTNRRNDETTNREIAGGGTKRRNDEGPRTPEAESRKSNAGRLSRAACRLSGNSRFNAKNAKIFDAKSAKNSPQPRTAVWPQRTQRAQRTARCLTRSPRSSRRSSQENKGGGQTCA